MYVAILANFSTSCSSLLILFPCFAKIVSTMASKYINNFSDQEINSNDYHPIQSHAISKKWLKIRKPFLNRGSTVTTTTSRSLCRQKLVTIAYLLTNFTFLQILLVFFNKKLLQMCKWFIFLSILFAFYQISYCDWI